MDIQKIAYDMYCMDWVKTHVDVERLRDVLDDYLDNCQSDYSTFKDYLDENGFFGAYPACFEEFLEYEYLDTDYMFSLLPTKEARDAYAWNYEMIYEESNGGVI